MNSVKTSFKIGDKIVWCPRGPNVTVNLTSSSSAWLPSAIPHVATISTTSSLVIVTNCTITTNASSSWSQPVMCTGVWGPTRPPRRGLDGVVLHEGEEHGVPCVQIQFSDGWVERIIYPETRIRLLRGCSSCPYRLYRITGECPGDPDLIKNEGKGV